MKIDLFKLIEENNKIVKEENELEFKKELKEVIKDIMDCNEYFVSDNELFIEKIKLKPVKAKKHETFKKEDKRLMYYCNTHRYKYKFKLTKSNIKLIQDYINKEN